MPLEPWRTSKHNLIAADLVSGTRRGYRFKVEIVKDTGDGLPGFIVVAVPDNYPTPVTVVLSG